MERGVNLGGKSQNLRGAKLLWGWQVYFSWQTLLPGYILEI